MLNAPDIVKSIIDQIPLEAQVLSIDTTRIYLCSTLHIMIGKVVKDENDLPYTVTDLLYNEWIEVKPKGASPEPFAGPIVKAQAVPFFHGTPMSVNDQATKHMSRDLDEITPFIWLVSGYDYDGTDPESSIEMDLSGNLRFLGSAHSKLWTNDEHNDLAIKPMQNLAEAFNTVVDEDYNFHTRKAFTYRDRIRFGVEVTNKGNTRNILDMNLSGLDGKISLEVYDTEACKC